jgi:large subunit ribosomal protein L25
VLYGQGREPLPFQVELPKLRAAMTTDAGRHAIIRVSIPGEGRPTPAILKDFQLDPVRDRVTHVDLMAISMREKMVTSVSLHVEGESPGVAAGGVLETPVNEIEIEVLPSDMPDTIVVDVSGLEVGDTLRLSDLAPPSGVTWSSDPETVLATVKASTTAADLEHIAEDEAEAAAEAAGLEEPAEPELVDGETPEDDAGA